MKKIVCYMVVNCFVCVEFHEKFPNPFVILQCCGKLLKIKNVFKFIEFNILTNFITKEEF